MCVKYADESERVVRCGQLLESPVHLAESRDEQPDPQIEPASVAPVTVDTVGCRPPNVPLLL